MKLFIKSAIRNVHRNVHSTLLNGIGITLSVFVLILIFSLSRGIEEQIVSRSIKFETGALMIDFDEETSSFDNVSGDSLMSQIVATLENNNEISSYNYRIYSKKSTLYLQNNTQSVNVIGLMDRELTQLREMVKLLSGTVEFGDSKKGIIVSNGIANEYNLKVGDECNIMSQSVDGAVNLNDFIIIGVFRYTSQMNKYNVYMDFEQAKELYNCNLPSRILINIHDIRQVDELKVALSKQLNCMGKSDNLPDKKCSGFEISSYKEYVGMAKSLSNINRYGMLSVAVFLVLISFIGIWSMQIENIHERSKEIGTLLSMGFHLQSVKKIFLYESVIISLVYFHTGMLIALIIILVISIQDGVYLGDNASFAFGSSIINPILSVKDIVNTFVIALIYPLLATVISLSVLNKKSIINPR